MAKTANIFCAVHTIGLLGIEKHEVNKFLQLLKLQKGCRVICSQINGDIVLIVIAENISSETAKKLCDYTTERILGSFGGMAYGVDSPALSYLITAKLLSASKRVAIASTESAIVLNERLEAVPGYLDAFIFAGYHKRRNESPEDHARELAREAMRDTACDYGAVITDIFRAGSGELHSHEIYVALTDGTNCYLDKFVCDAENKKHQLLDEALMGLFRMIMEKTAV